MPIPDFADFLLWFQSEGGYVDLSAMDVVNLPLSEGGRGAVALRDIPEGHTLFSTPWSLVLGKRTSVLLAKFGIDAWKNFKLHEGWSGLILNLMWEAAMGTDSRWFKYFKIVPKQFDTPMFWGDDDLLELKGTAVVDKLGKEQVEIDYKEKIVPAMQSRPDLFPPTDLAIHYSFDMYHIMGSLLLTRSFTLKDPVTITQDAQSRESESEGVSTANAMKTDDGQDMCQDLESLEMDDNDDEDEDGEEEVIVIPLADMLNARYGHDNVKPFCELDCFKMVSTKPIKAGEQLWNTYDDRPNSELLRGFGFVDYLPLPAHLFGENKLGNPGDIAEIRADLVLEQARCARKDAIQVADLHERINWWLEEGGDDVFILEIAPSTKSLAVLGLPPALVSFIRIILFDSEWDRSKTKGKPPKPRIESFTLNVMTNALEKRLEDYQTTLQEDEMKLASSISTLSPNKRHALIVRIGEKRILHIYLQRIHELLGELRVIEESEKAPNSKRKAADDQKRRKKEKRNKTD